MKKEQVPWNGRTYECWSYDQTNLEDESSVLKNFLFWKTTATLATTLEEKTPQLPETFSERFVCFVCGLLYKAEVKSGPDAFKSVKGNIDENIVRAVEIKATITPTGFTDIKRDLNFDELYWLRLVGKEYLQFEIYRMVASQFEAIAAKTTKTPPSRDRATVNLINIVKKFDIAPEYRGRIGVLINS